MEREAPLCLWFDAGIPRVVRARISYAFRTFCAVYRRTSLVLESSDHPPAGAFRYGIELPAIYDGRPANDPAPAPVHVGKVPVFHGNGGRVDWLGEIFEWISCADEYAVLERDAVGRIPYRATLHGRYELDPTIPYASIAMQRFARSIGVAAPEGKTRVAASHDLDYVPTSALGDVRRLAKNVGIALVNDRDVRLAAGIVGSAFKGLLRRRSPLDNLRPMRERERKRGFRSTSNVICRNTCSRDANYSLDDPRILHELRELERSGAELGVHASYMSLRDGGFEKEIAALRDLGFNVRGVRAHWLRYAGSDLFDAVADSGLEYDSTVGFADRVGFRSGASFVYRPYDFSAEMAYPFYEVPLAIMDGALYAHARSASASPRALAERVLDMADAFPSGAVSVLWHNTVFEGAQLPREVGALYWDLPRAHQRWTTNARVVDDEAPWFDRAFAQGDPVRC